MNNQVSPEPSSKDSKEGFATRIRRKLKNVISNHAEQEWDELLSEGQNGDEDFLTEHERSLIKAALKLDTVTVDEISIPRSEMVTIPLTATFSETVAVFQNSRRTRLPVIGEHLDDVHGVLALKDFAPFIGQEANFSVETCMRPAVFMPENMTLDKALQHLKKQRSQMAIVVDEYGGTAGLATLKDMLEELVGDLDDEDADNDPLPPEKLREGTFKLDPRWLMEDLREQFNWPEPLDDDEDFETVSGYIFSLVGRIPQMGEKVHGAYGETFHITQTNGRQILALEITINLSSQ